MSKYDQICSQDSVASIVTTDDRGNVVLSTAGVRDFLNCQTAKTCSGANPSSLSLSTGGCFPSDISSGVVKPVTHFHPVLRLRMNEAMPLLPQIFMAFTITSYSTFQNNNHSLYFT
jgi:hypothetical protein